LYIVYAKLIILLSKLKCFKRTVWNYQNIDEAAELNYALLNYEWERCFIGGDDVNIIFNNWFSSC
jgi:hypothetical protein